MREELETILVDLRNELEMRLFDFVEKEGGEVNLKGTPYHLYEDGYFTVTIFSKLYIEDEHLMVDYTFYDSDTDGNYDVNDGEEGSDPICRWSTEEAYTIMSRIS